VSKVTSHTVVAVSVVTHPPPFSKHSTAQGQGSARPALRAVWWGAHHTSPVHHLCRPQVPEAGPRLKPAGQQTVGGQQKGQQRPGAHAACRIAHMPSARLDSPIVRLATRRVELLQSLCELASGRLDDVSGESLAWSLRISKRDQVHLYDDSVSLATPNELGSRWRLTEGLFWAERLATACS
jgi:hypothetical protein